MKSNFLTTLFHTSKLFYSYVIICHNLLYLYLVDRIFPCFGNRRILEEMRVMNARLSYLEERITVLSNYTIDQGMILDVLLSPGLKPGAPRCTSAPTTRILCMNSPPATRETEVTGVTRENRVTGETGATRETRATEATRETGVTRETEVTRETGATRERLCEYVV